MSENEEKAVDTEQAEGTHVAEKTPETVPADPPADNRATPSPEERGALLEAEKAELKDRMLRIAADFENYKRRARKDQSDGEARAKEGVLRDLLEVMDNLERATAAWAGKEVDAKAVKEGVELVLRQFRSKLERYQVKALEAVGQPFDPRFHEAISQVPAPGAAPGSVVHEMQKGYLVGDKLLRPAMVVVASAAPARDGGSTAEMPPDGEGKS